jgi:hypothetical protein
VPRHRLPLEPLDRRLEVHDRRLELLRSHRRAIGEKLRQCEGAQVPPAKGLDGSRDMTSLTYERDTIDREIRVHETLVALARDPKVLDALQEVSGSVPLAREAARDPKAFAHARGISFPRNLVVSVEIVGGRVRVTAAYYDEVYSATLVWDGGSLAEAT